MKQFFNTICIITILAGLVFSANSRVLKSEFKKDKMKRVEPDYRRGTATRDACPMQYPNNPNSVLTVIDSSANGYGMVSTVTRPMDVNSDGNMLVVYRQYAGENTTHGQLGAGYGVVTDGEVQWDVQYNVNANGNPPWDGGGVGGEGTAQARYPSGIAGEEYPYAIWNEYTGNVAGWPAGCSSYGGRPYFSYDEFGWGGESWLYPAELDPLYDCEKDLWTGSVGYGYDADEDKHHIVAVYDDWTRTGSYQFTSEAVEDGYVVLGSETLAVNPNNLGTDGYSSAAILSMNDNGQGLLGIDGIFSGNDMDAGTCTGYAANLTCNKTPMFKLTDDYGETWPRTPGNMNSFDFYYVPDNVFDDIFDNFPNTDVDACTGEVSEINSFWSWYEFDMRVDQGGNPHIVISIIAESDDYFHFLDGYTGFYHLTIDRDNLDSPGAVNSPTGWNWSYIPLPANDSFEWNRPDGYSYLYGAMCQISLSRDNPDIVYMVANIANEGAMAAEYDANGDGIEDDPCGTQDNPWELYPEWSEDIWVAKSVDNGSTWTGLHNLTQTPRDPNHTGENNCSPEEQYSHTAHWSDDERVYFQYNQPNWEFNEIGDPLGADCMNRVFLGYSWVTAGMTGGCTDSGNCSYDDDAGFDDGSCGSGIYTCPDGSSGCGCDGACGDTLEAPAVEDCDGNCGGGAIVLCNSVASGGGEYCADAGTEVCGQYAWEDGDCADLNEWTDCAGTHCGSDDPLFYQTGCADAGYVACDGGRCYTCSGGTCNGAEANSVDCSACSGMWAAATDDDGNDVVTTEEGCTTGQWETFANEGFDANNNPSNETGSPNECYCTTAGAESGCICIEGDLNGDGGWNVLDIVALANCVLATTCGGNNNGCAADLNNDANYNVLDIVSLANCVLSDNCSGRVDDANHSKLIIENNMVSIEADGFIGGVQMTLTHGEDFSIEMTDRALLADYLTTGNETRLLVITPETDKLFSYSGDFEITEMIVANSQYEVSVDLPLAASFSISDAYPNPFNPTTVMELTMPVSGDMQVEVYNLLGQVVSTLASGYKDAGTYSLTWDASDVSSGMYFVKAHADGFTATQKLMLVK